MRVKISANSQQKVVAMKLINQKPSTSAVEPEQGSMPSAILVLMDGSPASQVGATLAIQIAQRQSLAIRGLYVIDGALVLNPYANYHHELAHDGVPESSAELVDWFQQQGDYALRWLEDQCHGFNVPVQTELIFGGLPDIIRRQEDQAVLLVLGRQGRAQADSPAALGHNFRVIAHHSHKPLLIGGRDQRHIQRILLVHEPGKQARTALGWSVRLQQSLPAALTVLTPSVNGNGSANLQKQLAGSGISEYHLMSGEELSADNISDAAMTCQADLIVMGGYHHNALLTKLVGSRLENVLQQTMLPVLVA